MSLSKIVINSKRINVGGSGNDFRLRWCSVRGGGGGGGPCCCPPGCSAQISSIVPTTPQRVSGYRQIGVIRCPLLSSLGRKHICTVGVRSGQKIFSVMRPNVCSACVVTVALHAGNHLQSLLFHLFLSTPAGLHGQQRC